jgi:3-oxoacyl-[acyl-carrier-protein] synthase II
MEQKTRVVITGLGAVSPFGIGTSLFWQRLCAGESGVGRITTLDARDFVSPIAGEVRDYDPASFMEPKAARRMDRFAQFAVTAAGEAIADARLDLVTEDRERVGVILNTGGGGIQTLLHASWNYYDGGAKRVSPLTIPMSIPNMAACQISIAHDIRGPVLASVAACAAGVQAIVDAYHLLCRGEVDVVIAGGSEALMSIAIIAFGNMGVLSRRSDDPSRASRPFDRDRDGCVLGEGCGVLVLETEEHAMRRDAGVYCEVAGGALTADAHHISVPRPGGEGAASAIRKALANTDTPPGAVDYICAHGTSTEMNDIAETMAIKSALGEAAYRVAISSPKSMVGHLFGGAGAISSIVCALAIRDNCVPPTINLDHPGDGCDLDYVPNVARRMPVHTAIANAFGFGGQNAVAVFRRYAPGD